MKIALALTEDDIVEADGAPVTDGAAIGYFKSASSIWTQPSYLEVSCWK